MHEDFADHLPDSDPQETAEWEESLESVIEAGGPERAAYLLHRVLQRAWRLKVDLPHPLQTPYINTIPPSAEPAYPGDETLEKKIRRIIRWNAVAMVTRANRRFDGLGGHISTYASSASLYEVALNHFLQGKDAPGGGDQVFIQGHAAPGIYARSYLAGLFSEEQLDHFRRETNGKGLSSYPHPWLMPDFWEFPTVSMGLGPMAAIYQARFNRYLHNRGIKDTSQNRVWCFMGDGESDEPESLGALSVAGREGLSNLVFVVNCNLQRLDGPVRGNGKIIQELEGVFRGAGWDVIKVVWGEQWDPLLAADNHGLLVKRMNEVVDGQYQKYVVETGDYVRRHFFGKDPRLLAMVDHLSDEQIKKLRRGGHSYRKLYSAYAAATEDQGRPVAILAKTVKGWSLGQGLEAANATHQTKKLDEKQLKALRDTLHLPIPDDRMAEVPYYHPGHGSEEVRYLLERRRVLGGQLPRRKPSRPKLKAPTVTAFEELLAGGKPGVQVSTTMACVRLLRTLLRDQELGKRIVPVIPDEARTFGMDALFREVGIYAPFGQKYDPVDSRMLLYYRESQQGQLLEEGITEAGAMASFTAAGTCYSTHGVTMIPFYMFYSMFGLQRTGDQIWAFGDARGRGFLLGATAGRTTLNGEGLQHEDGHSQMLALSVPNLRAYDPAYAYEVAVIVADGLRRMLDEDEDVFYYLTLYNENLAMPAMPPGVEEGILRGIYLRNPSPKDGSRRVQLFGSGPMLAAALEAQEVLAERYDVAADVWSVTSYQQLARDARSTERWNRLHPSEDRRVPYLCQALAKHPGPVVATSDWVSDLPGVLGKFIERRYLTLGTDGFGRSDTREALRRHFEVDAAQVVVAALHALVLEGKMEAAVVGEAVRSFAIDPDCVDPLLA